MPSTPKLSWIEHSPSKRVVAGSNPAGVATSSFRWLVSDGLAPVCQIRRCSLSIYVLFSGPGKAREIVAIAALAIFAWLAALVYRATSDRLACPEIAAI